VPKECSRCLFTDDIGGVVIGPDGVCNYCKMHDRLEVMYPICNKRLEKLVDDIRFDAHIHRRPYDCVIGVSGGADSSFLLRWAVESRLRVLAVHWDNGWNTPEAESNINVMVDSLGVDLIRYRATPEYHDLNKAFLMASVSEADVPNDIALLSVILQTANRYGIKANLSGHVFREEGTCPTGWTFMDSRYIQDVYRWATGEEVESFPLMSLRQQVWWGLRGIKTFRPLYHIDYDKERVKEDLHEDFGWTSYGAKHCENIYTAFVGSHLLPEKFHIDKRRIYYSALIRSEMMDKADAERLVAINVPFDSRYLSMVQDRYFEDDETFDAVMRAPIKTHRDYGDYFKVFRRYKPFFWLGTKCNVFPRTFYEKYVLVGRDAR